MSLRFDQRQLVAMEAIGLVPWVAEGDAAIAACEPGEAVATAPSAVTCQEPVVDSLLASQDGASVEVAAPSAAIVPTELTVAESHQLPDDTASKDVLGEHQNTTLRTNDANSAAADAPPAGQVVTPLPRELDALASWLPAQRLLSFIDRGIEQNMAGSKTARLLVVVDVASNEPGQAPLEGDAQRMFELMMRAINLTRRDVATVGISADDKAAQVATHANHSETTLANVCADHTRAVLVMQQCWDFQSQSATEHHARLPLNQLPVWRMPHPDSLLLHSALKRPAWQVLKAVQTILSGG